jgi:hypothetical protein
VFNLTNHRHVVCYNASFGAGAYPSSPLTNLHQVLVVAGPRSLQLAAWLRF